MEDLSPEMAGAVRQAARTAIEQAEESRNRGFKQVYPRGWRTIRMLAQERSTLPLRLWTWLAENSGPDSTVCVRQKDLAAEMDVGVRQIQRAIALLEAKAGLVAFTEFGLSVYAIDPRAVWASWRQATRWAPFNTKTLVPVSGREGEAFAARVKLMSRKFEETPEGPIPVPSAFESLDQVAEAHDAATGRRPEIQADADERRATAKKRRITDNREADAWDVEQGKKKKAAKTKAAA